MVREREITFAWGWGWGWDIQLCLKRITTVRGCVRVVPHHTVHAILVPAREKLHARQAPGELRTDVRLKTVPDVQCLVRVATKWARN